MIRKTMLTGFILLGLGFTLGAQAGQLETLGFAPTARDGLTEYRQVVGDVGVTILPNPQVTPMGIRFLGELGELLPSLQVIKPESILLTLRTGESVGVLRVSDLTVEGRQLVNLLPEGLVFRYANALVYDFSMVIDNLRLRVRGQFLNEQELVTKLLRIANNPSEYLLSQDSEYVFRFMKEVQAQNKEILEQLAQTQSDLTRAHDRIAELETDLTQSNEDFETLMNGLLVLNSRSLFGGLSDFDRSAVSMLVEWGRNNPDATQKDARDWVKDQNLNISNRVIQAVMVLFFNTVE